jgi:L-amino acid N-acyltransferase YncA
MRIIQKKRLHKGISIHIDEWTNSIVEVSTGKIYKTDFKRMTAKDAKEIASHWYFGWKDELKDPGIQVYKMYIIDSPKIIQGLISLHVDKGFIEVRYAENSEYMKKTKIYRGVGTNLFAYACKLSKEQGFGGFIGFIVKSNVIKHYAETLGAKPINKHKMYIDNIAAEKLIKFYFP